MIDALAAHLATDRAWTCVARGDALRTYAHLWPGHGDRVREGPQTPRSARLADSLRTEAASSD